MQSFGKFAVVKKLAEGGMGEVLLVRQRGLGQVMRLVVLKRLRPKYAADESFAQRFLREARISARLSHPNIVQTYEFGRLESSYFLTLEYVRGATLGELTTHLRDSGAQWPLDVVLEIVMQVCSGLRYVHELRDFDGRFLGIIHRDISPPNIMVSLDGVVKLLDFGVAHVSDQVEDPALIVGKLAYLAPEQWQRTALTPKTDLFALGVVLWELLTGERLFAGTTRALLMEAALGLEIVPPSQLRAGLPKAVDALCLRLLERDPEPRHASAQEVAQEVERIVETEHLATGPRMLERFMQGLTRVRQGIVDDEEGLAASSERSGRPVLRLLLVDDEPDNLDAMQRVLRDRFEVIACTDPLEALRTLEAEPIDVLVTDHRMPQMTGLELVELANRIAPGTLKVMVSAYMDADLLLRAINAGRIHRYILKPWSVDELRGALDELLAAQPLHVAALERRVRQEATGNEPSSAASDDVTVAVGEDGSGT